jgi:D-beta-D-heptose 7-phosphate kinase/D-beta-D-heptose 1-phosphate adenosyltransferase
MRNRGRKTLQRIKIKTPLGIKKTLVSLRKKGLKVIFTNGCFDLLHYGHVKYLQDAKRLGDILIVGINTDSSVRKIKGNKRPIINELDRAKTVAALESVDYVVLFKEETPLELIKLIRPDIIVKGADWKRKEIVGRAFVSGYGGRVAHISFVKNRSTTNIINKIAARY